MSTKWLAVILVSIALALVNCQNNSSTTEATNTTTSTVAPTTASPKTTTSTPITTSTSSPTPKPTTSVPSTTPQPAAQNWTVSDNNTICLSAKFDAIVTIWYNNINHSQSQTNFTFPSDALVLSESHCNFNESEPQLIVIGFSNKDTSANLSLTFTTNNNEVRVQEVELSFVLTDKLFPELNQTLHGKKEQVRKDDLSLFKVASAHAYTCSAQSVDLGGDNKTEVNNIKIDFHNSKVEAFIKKENKGVLDSEIDCKATEISDVVPIAVGAALAGLVVIVLIAYFIGRRRSRRLAYQSV